MERPPWTWHVHVPSAIDSDPPSNEAAPRVSRFFNLDNLERPPYRRSIPSISVAIVVGGRCRTSQPSTSANGANEAAPRHAPWVSKLFDLDTLPWSGPSF